jgi:hypothetical protein
VKENKITLPLESGENDLIGGYAVYDADGDWLCDALNEERANLIVRAVNNHDALVKALEKIEEAVTLVRFNVGDKIPLWLDAEAFDALVDVRAALAKAKGGRGENKPPLLTTEAEYEAARERLGVIMDTVPENEQEMRAQGIEAGNLFDAVLAYQEAHHPITPPTPDTTALAKAKAAS